MLHPTMLGDAGPTCWLRLNRPLWTCEFKLVVLLALMKFELTDGKFCDNKFTWCFHKIIFYCDSDRAVSEE